MKSRSFEGEKSKVLKVKEKVKHCRRNNRPKIWVLLLHQQLKKNTVCSCIVERICCSPKGHLSDVRRGQEDTLLKTYEREIQIRSSWLNCALRDDEAVYWVIIGHYEAVEVGNWLYWVSRGHLCLYILHKVEIWTGVTDASLTDSLTDNFER